jgi:hypothetical protein
MSPSIDEDTADPGSVNRARDAFSESAQGG